MSLISISTKRKKNSMKLNKSFITLIVLSCFALTSVSSAQAFSFSKKKNNAQTISTYKTKPVKNKRGEIVQPPYTNEVHSVFTLSDCIENAVMYNSGIVI